MALLTTCVAPAVRGDDVADEADLEFRLGTERYQAGDYRLALSHFLASNRLARNRNVTFDIARCYEQLQQYPEAHRYYTRALEGEDDPAAVARIEQAIARIAPHVALLRIETEPPGARLYLDRKDLGERGVAPQRMALPPATYRVIAELDGWQDAVSDPVDVRLGAEQTVKLVLRRIVGTVHVPGPPGATARLEAEGAPASCRAPCDLEAPPGQHTVVVEQPGFRPQRVPVSVEARRTAVVQVDLVAETGSLVVNSDERGASIEIDGVTRGFTPALLTVPVGQHAVTVELRGFQPVGRRVTIASGVQSHIDVTLLPADSVEAASRLPESVEDAPASVSIVSSQELRAMRYPTLAEALRGVRGVYLSDDRGYEALGFRGFGLPGSYGNRVLVTLDGVPLNDDWVWSSYVGFDLRTDLEDVDRIEVVRGPGSVVYGTSAFSGVVNLVTRSRDAPDGWEVGLASSGDGVARGRARITQHLGHDGGVWASVAAGESAGRDFFFPEYAADGPPEVAGNARGVDGARFGTVTGRAWWRELSLAWSANYHDKNLPTGQFETLLGDGRTHQIDSRAFVEARYEPKLGSWVTSLTRLHADAYAYRGYFARSPADGGLETTQYDSYWAGAEQRFVATPSPAVSLSVGGEGQVHPRARQADAMETSGPTSVAPRGYSQTQSFALGALYGSLDVRPARWLKLSAGQRLDYYSTFGASYSPRFAVIVRPYAGANLKFIAGKAFRAPSIYELSYTGFGQSSSPGLQPENMYSAEIEATQRVSRTVVATASVFANYMTDLIALQNSAQNDQLIQYVNTKTPVGSMGGEIEVRRDWKEGWMVAASYSLQRTVYLASASFADFAALRRSPSYGEVPNSPTHMGAVRAAVPLFSRATTVMTRLTLESGRFVIADPGAPPGTPQAQTGASAVWDFVFTGTESRWGLTYSLGVYNAFDCRAAYPVSDEFRQRSIPMSGRSLLAAASLSF